ncbi:hypothetical protein BCR36DRAFT_587695 [Piromyces finnis]|uniref:Dickkopf N-terminal cysteine-rich domain-containing protein n=1 Tax=Piromyces finnis TaxID=1754191 RepID=A0A1Y1UW43_9FUNG|nr:hypothetical protein BCR36DRAFT_587695 [Piromyces finnis]|eukprot:ORX41832.1 hypothetical protein BCR36DRAFT_587695 [Piromyces finnis]
MFNKTILTFLFIIIYFQFASANELNEVLSKKEVLNITNEFFISYYCKDDICVKTDNEYKEKFVEIPDKNERVIKYIVDTCSSEEIINGRCFSEKCISDAHCLSNKCIDSHCAFNEETPIVHCDDIYIGVKKSYMHCGKPYGDTCKTDDECSSKKCGLYDGLCRMQAEGPHDDEVFSKEEVLKITSNNYISYYCKNDTCVSYDDYYHVYFVDIPDENNNFKRYIVDTCTVDDIKNGRCYHEECTSDSQCLSNKCIDKHCAFNEETPIDHCEYIDSYMHCGKPHDDTCKTNDECSSKICNKYGICDIQKKGSDSDYIEALKIIFFLIPLCTVYFIIFLNFYFVFRNTYEKHSKNRKNKKDALII